MGFCSVIITHLAAKGLAFWHVNHSYYCLHFEVRPPRTADVAETQNTVGIHLFFPLKLVQQSKRH